MTAFYYLAPGEIIIRIKTEKKPSKTELTWAYQHFTGTHWETDQIGEITWGRLRQWKYLGSDPLKESKAGIVE